MANKRTKTNYPGVYHREVQRAGGGTERVFYIVFKRHGKTIEEKVGRQFQDNMTPAKASKIRIERMEGKRKSRKEVREEQRLAASTRRWTIDRIWREYQIQKSENKSIKTDVNRYDRYLKNQFGTKDPCELRTIQIDRYRSELLKQYSPQTTKHILGLLKRLITFGVKKGLCEAPEPKLLQFEMPKIDNAKTECMTPEQLSAYWKALDEESDQNAATFLRLALTTGMRRGALFALCWDDIDFEKGFITLRGDVAKNGTTEKIPISELAKQALVKIEKGESPFVFPGRGGERRKEYKRIAQRVRDKAGLPKSFRPLHGLRHTYASLLASSGKVDLYTLQKLLTHNSPQMTQRYAHLADEALKRAAAVGDDVFAEVSG